MNLPLTFVAAVLAIGVGAAAQAAPLGADHANPYEVQTPSSPSEAGPITVTARTAIDAELAHGAIHQTQVQQYSGSYYSQSTFPSSPNESAPWTSR